MMRSEIISKLSKRIHQKLRKKDLEKFLNIILDKLFIYDKNIIKVQN